MKTFRFYFALFTCDGEVEGDDPLALKKKRQEHTHKAVCGVKFRSVIRTTAVFLVGKEVSLGVRFGLGSI